MALALLTKNRTHDQCISEGKKSKGYFIRLNNYKLGNILAERRDRFVVPAESPFAQ